MDEVPFIARLARIHSSRAAIYYRQVKDSSSRYRLKLVNRKLPLFASLQPTYLVHEFGPEENFKRSYLELFVAS